MSEVTFQATVLKELTQLMEKLEKLNPDTRSNTGRRLGKAFMLKMISTYADKQYDNEMKVLNEEKIIDDPAKLTEGDYVLGESPKFTVTCKVSAPRRSFDPDVLALMLKKRYKVPEPISKDFIEKSKTPGSSNKTIKILER